MNKINDSKIRSILFLKILSLSLFCQGLGIMGSLMEAKPALAQSGIVNFSGTVLPPFPLTNLSAEEKLSTEVDRLFSQEYIAHLNVTPKNNIDILQLPAFLDDVDEQTSTKTAIVYVYLQPATSDVLEKLNNIDLLNSSVGGVLPPNKDPKSTDELTLIVITGKGGITPIKVSKANRRDMLLILREFQASLVNLADEKILLPQASQFYEWIISPIKEVLKQQKITHISFIVDAGLRSLPIAAFYNQGDDKYLVEEYSLGLMPSLALTNITRQNLDNVKLLAMGAETFKTQKPLPGVPLELDQIGRGLWNGKIYLNQDFTVNNFNQALITREYSIVHLATHGVFQPGASSNSFLSFSDRNINLDQFSTLGLEQPIDLLTLSACQTAMGDAEAEMGFSGLAVKTGVRTAMGSFWQVSDEGTLMLMTSFYNQLKSAPIKAEALRQAQRNFIEKKITINDEQLIIGNHVIPLASLNPELRRSLMNKDFNHPYYWSAFTLVGNPW